MKDPSPKYIPFRGLVTILEQNLVNRILQRLHLAARPNTDLAGLRELYAAWCASVPFDNLAKLIALRSGNTTRLPGIEADEFFERWLLHGAGGTCWTTSNALCELLLALGFDARRVAGSMRDTGYLGHGSVKVRIDGNDWLVDSSMLTDVPLPLTDEIFISDQEPFGAEVERIDGVHMIWADLPPTPTLIPCRLMVDPATHSLYADRYEASRQRSPFNERLYARRNLPGQRLVLVGATRFLKTAFGLESRELTADELCDSLRNEFGISDAFVDAWRKSGALDASLAPSSGPTPPAITAQPPSRRAHVDI